MSRFPPTADHVRHIANGLSIHNLRLVGCYRPLNSPLKPYHHRQPQYIPAATVFTAAQLEKSLADERLIPPPRRRAGLRLRGIETHYILPDSTTREVKVDQDKRKEDSRSAPLPPLPSPEAREEENEEEVQGHEAEKDRPEAMKRRSRDRRRPALQFSGLRANSSGDRRRLSMLKHVAARAEASNPTERLVTQVDKLNIRRYDPKPVVRFFNMGDDHKELQEPDHRVNTYPKYDVSEQGSREIEEERISEENISGLQTLKKPASQRLSWDNEHPPSSRDRRLRNLAFRAESKQKRQAKQLYEAERMEYLRGKAGMPEQNEDAGGQVAESDMFAALEGIGSNIDSDGLGLSNEHASKLDGEASDESNNLDWGDLPLSPLMHPELIQARTKYHRMKPLPSKDPSDFEIKMAKSPYAELLATPVRVCRLTGARLPTAFMTRFTILKHPDTGKLWQVPNSYHPSRVEYSFLDKTDEREVERANLEEPAEVSEVDQNPSTTEPYKADGIESDEPKAPPGIEHSVPSFDGEARANAKLKRVGGQFSSNYMIATRSIIDQVLKLKPRQRHNIYPHRWQERFGHELVETGHWREDMGHFIQELMQKKVTRLLAYTAHINEHYFSPYKPGKETGMSYFKPGSAVLWLRSSQQAGTQGDFVRFVASMANDHKCVVQAPFNSTDATLLHDPHKPLLPVFNLRSLLGDAAMRRLEARHSMFGCHAIYVHPKQTTADLVAWIWRLAGYGKGAAGDSQKSKISSRSFRKSPEKSFD